VRDIYLLEFVAMFLVWLIVTVVYHFTTGGAWRRTSAGRLLMADSVLFVWVTALILAGILFHNYPGRILVGIVSYALFVATGVWRLRLIVKAQSEKRRERREQQGRDVPSHRA
jgi:Kef-type K+ transport system membrane component KefB